MIITVSDCARATIVELEKLRAENEQLRAIFSTAAEEFAKLKGQVSYLERELSHERQRNTILEENNGRLKSELGRSEAAAKKFASMLFGLKSEKLKLSNIRDKDLVILESASGKTVDLSMESSGDSAFTQEVKNPRGAVPGHPGKGRTIPNDLPVLEVVQEVPQEQRTCPDCGRIRPEKPGMETVSYEVAVKKQYYLRKLIRRTYGPSCSCRKEPEIIVASAVPKLIARGKYSEDIWVDLLISKFMSHAPINRQLFEMVQSGINIKSGMVFNAFKKIYFEHLEALYEALLTDLRLSGRWHADETRWKMFLGESSNLWYMWAFRSEKIVAFVLDPSRASSVPLKTLFNLEAWEAEYRLSLNTKPLQMEPHQMKKLNVDRYSAYKVLAKYGLALLAYCWAHVRRDFIDVQKKFPNNKELCRWAEEWIIKIADLFHINNERVKYQEGSELFLEYDTRLRRVLWEMKAESEKTYNDERTKAMNSMKEHWSGLNLFVEYPELPMDNNLMENAIRPCALGRNNFLGNHSIWGGNLTACMYSIIQTCLLNKINPKSYLTYYFNVRMKQGKTMDTNTIKSCLPYNLDNETRLSMALKKY